MEPINIKEMNLAELKALAYDQLVLSENTRRNLDSINQEITARGTSETKVNKKP